jgi:predicted nucleic acid-binding Zn ribbon protein
MDASCVNEPVYCSQRCDLGTVFAAGRTNILFRLVHMLVFAVFVFMVFVPWFPLE